MSVAQDFGVTPVDTQTASTAPPFPPGEHTEFLKQLGESRSGSVWLVRYFGRLEAWRIVPRGLASDTSLKEAWSRGTFDHPQIVSLIDIRTEEHHDCLVLRMEFIAGNSLRDTVRDHGIRTPGESLELVQQIADVFQVAHDKKIHHQDLKPQNVLVSEDGALHLTGFGVACALREFSVAPENEELASEDGPKSDVVAVGSLLQYLLTGSVDDTEDFASFPWIRPPLQKVIRDLRSGKVPTIKKAIRRLSEVDDRSANDDAFARGDYEEAKAGYQAADESKMAESVATFHREQQDILNDVVANLRDGGLRHAFEKLTTLPLQFSRSSSLLTSREQVIERIVDVYRSAPQRIEDLQRGGDFAGARRALEEVRGLSECPASRELLHQDPATILNMPGLAAMVAESEQSYRSLEKDIEEAVRNLDFRRAHRCAEELQQRFPSQQGAEHATDLREAAELWDFVQDYRGESLGAFEADPVPSLVHGSLKRAVDCCDRLLQKFPNGDPELETVTQVREQLVAVATGSRQRVIATLETAESLEGDRRHHQAAEILTAVRGLVDGTDLFDVNLRQRFRAIHRRLNKKAEDAAQAYRQGKRLLEEHHYPEALQQLERAQELSAHAYEDLDSLRKRCKARLESRTQLETEFHSLVPKVHGTDIRAQDLLRLVELAPHLLELSDAEAKSVRHSELDDALRHYWNTLESRLGTAPEPDRVEAQLEQLAGVLAAMSPEHFAPVLEGQSGQHLCHLCDCAIQVYHNGTALPKVLDQLEFLQQVMQVLEKSSRMLAVMETSGDSPHPAVGLARGLDDLHQRCSRQDAERLDTVCFDLCTALKTWAPPETAATVATIAAGIRHRRRKRETASFLKRMVRAGGWVLGPAAIVVVSYFAGQRSGVDAATVKERQDESEALTSELGLERWSDDLKALASGHPRLWSTVMGELRAYQSKDTAQSAAASFQARALLASSLGRLPDTLPRLQRLRDEMTIDLEAWLTESILETVRLGGSATMRSATLRERVRQIHGTVTDWSPTAGLQAQTERTAEWVALTERTAGHLQALHEAMRQGLQPKPVEPDRLAATWREFLSDVASLPRSDDRDDVTSLFQSALHRLAIREVDEGLQHLQAVTETAESPKVLQRTLITMEQALRGLRELGRQNAGVAADVERVLGF